MKRKFIYENLGNILHALKNINIKSIETELLVSMEKDYYGGSAFVLLCEELHRSLLSLNCISDDNFKITKFRFGVCDSLNRHNWYYRYALEYMKDNNLSEENQISEKKQAELKEKSYQKAVEQGEEWFMNNINAINLLLPESRKLPRKLPLNDEITVLYDGDENTPRIEFMRYNYWLNHPEYKETEKALRKVCNLDNSLVERAFQHTVDRYYNRTVNNESVKSRNFLKRQSYKYLFDEVVSFIIKHRIQNNLIEFYFGGEEPSVTAALRGRKIKNDLAIQPYLEGSLKGADQRKIVSVKMVEE